MRWCASAASAPHSPNRGLALTRVLAAGAQCEWTIECGEGYSHISLLFSRVETEEDIDVVVRTHLANFPCQVLQHPLGPHELACARQSVFDGQTEDSNQLSRLSGSDVPPVPPLPPPFTERAC